MRTGPNPITPKPTVPSLLDCKMVVVEGSNTTSYLQVLPTKWPLVTHLQAPQRPAAKFLCHHSLLINLYLVNIETLSLRSIPFLLDGPLPFFIY
jgi:hypothetical protein